MLLDKRTLVQSIVSIQNPSFLSTSQDIHPSVLLVLRIKSSNKIHCFKGWLKCPAACRKCFFLCSFSNKSSLCTYSRESGSVSMGLGVRGYHYFDTVRVNISTLRVLHLRGHTRQRQTIHARSVTLFTRTVSRDSREGERGLSTYTWFPCVDEDCLYQAGREMKIQQCFD
jgi:hypothetical protein